MKQPFTILCLFICLNSFAKIVYVKADATGANNGTSWQNAYSKLQDGLAAASGGDQVWVAAGTYYPDEGAGQTDNDRRSFFMLKSGVGIYGGFSGNETQLTQRHPQTQITVLSGDLQQNDGNDVFTGRDENSFHVVQAVNVDNTALIDGFTIRGGQADVSGQVVNPDDYSGGGMLIRSSSPVVSHCRFTGNEANSKGGGIFSQDASANISVCTFDGNRSGDEGGGVWCEGTLALNSCIFSNNDTQEYGGGLYLQGTGTSQVFATVINCSFLNNSSSYYGGGVGQWSDATFTNCVFSGNTAPGDIDNYGGAALMLLDDSQTTLLNCTFSGAASYGPAIESGVATLTVSNSIFWGNPAGDIQAFNPTVSYSIVQGGYSGTGNLSIDPLFVDAANGNLHLQPCSPAIDAGSDAVQSYTADRDINDRKLDAITGGSVIDMGAYEFQSSLDADHDGHSYCNNQDCNDNDASVWRTGNFYKDADGDGYTVGDAQSICYGNNTPAGFSTTKSVTDDCNDNNASVHSPQAYYVDADHDGYGSTATAMLCASTPPVGYAVNNTDCNDNDASVNPNTIWVLDKDGDGYYTGNTIMQCTSPGVGYVIKTTQQPGDCMDNDNTVYPGAPELCDGKDNNCNGQTDEGCANVTATLLPSFTIEGNSGKVPTLFIVILNKPAAASCSVKYTTYDLSAKAGSDYQQTNGTVSFTKGQWLKLITVYVYGDKQVEDNEQFGVQLQNPVNVKINGSGKATGTIINDDHRQNRSGSAFEAIAETAINPGSRSLKIFPNPASNLVNVNAEGYTGDITIQLATAEGKIVKQLKLQTLAKFAQQQINVADLSAGIYLLTVTDGKGGRQTEKVIISR